MAQIGAHEVKVPLEALSYRFRKLQKHLSREVEAEIKNIKELQQQRLSTINSGHEEEYDHKYVAIRNRLDILRTLTIDSDIAEKECLSRIQTRTSAIIAKRLSAEDKIMILVADYLLRLREFPCVEQIMKEYGPWLGDYLDAQEHAEAHAVEVAIREDDLSVVLSWCQAHASKLRRIDSVLEFYIAQEEFLTLVFANKPQDALQYAQTHLASLVGTPVTDKGSRVGKGEATTASAAAGKPGGDKRQRAATMGFYESQGSAAAPQSSQGVNDRESGGMATNVPVFNQFTTGCNSDKSTTPQHPDSEQKVALRHLTGLLVYPTSSPEVTMHPRYGPLARPDRLARIMDLFQTDFRNVYGISETSPLETYLATGIAVLKTPTCDACFGGSSDVAGSGGSDVTTPRSPMGMFSRSSRSSNNSSSATQPSHRSRGLSSAGASAVGAAFNRLRSAGGTGRRGEETIAENSGGAGETNRPPGGFFRGFSNIGGFLNISSRRTRSHSMSAVEENFSSVNSSSASRHNVHSVEGTEKPVGVLRGQSENVEMEVDSQLLPCDQSGDATSSVTDNISTIITNRLTMPQHPCYSSYNNTNIQDNGSEKLTGGKRRAEECPVCSREGGVGADLASAVPSFASPVSVLVCRGSGEVMSHSNPPMALPNGQVFGREFLLATAIKKEVRNNVKNNHLRGSNGTTSSDPAIPASRLSPQGRTRLAFRGREESRWSVIRRLAAHSTPASASSMESMHGLRHRRGGRVGTSGTDEGVTTSAAVDVPTETRQSVLEEGRTLPEQVSPHTGSASDVDVNIMETVSRGDDGIFRSRTSAVFRPPPTSITINSPTQASSSSRSSNNNMLAQEERTSPSCVYFRITSPTRTRRPRAVGAAAASLSMLHTEEVEDSEGESVEDLDSEEGEEEEEEEEEEYIDEDEGEDMAVAVDEFLERHGEVSEDDSDDDSAMSPAGAVWTRTRETQSPARRTAASIGNIVEEERARPSSRYLRQYTPGYRHDATQFRTGVPRRGNYTSSRVLSPNGAEEEQTSPTSGGEENELSEVLFAVCPITGQQFEFSSLRTVFLA